MRIKPNGGILRLITKKVSLNNKLRIKEKLIRNNL